MTEAEEPEQVEETTDEETTDEEKDHWAMRAAKKVGNAAKKPFAAAARLAFDEYIAEKLDEIERRVDGKLDEIEDRDDRKLDDIDGKMDDWRTREVRHRLRILKYTIIATVIVAGLSLIYTYLIR